jgi:hypothetical protein
MPHWCSGQYERVVRIARSGFAPDAHGDAARASCRLHGVDGKDRIVRDFRGDTPRIAVQTEFHLARRRAMSVVARTVVISPLP